MPKKLVTALVCAVLMGSATAATDNNKTIADALNKAFPGAHITSIQESPVPGLYQVLLGAEVIYVSQDGRYIFKGNLYDLQDRTNISEHERSIARRKILSAIPRDEMIEFSPPQPKHFIYVFTDVTCPYCRKLHKDVPALNKLGIGVRYLAFPRAGIGSDAFKEMEAVWCSTDRQKAITEAKAGKPVKTAMCDNPVAKEFKIGEKLGIHGTPAIFLENGTVLYGYATPTELSQAVADE